MSSIKSLIRNTLIALAVFGLAAGSTAVFQPSVALHADGSRPTDYDAG